MSAAQRKPTLSRPRSTGFLWRCAARRLEAVLPQPPPLMTRSAGCRSSGVVVHSHTLPTRSKTPSGERVPGKRIAWQVIDSDLTFSSAKHEWTGTVIELDLRSHGRATTIVFSHRGLVPAFECYGDCSNAWATLIGKSLRRWIETGEVQPSPW